MILSEQVCLITTRIYHESGPLKFKISPTKTISSSKKLASVTSCITGEKITVIYLNIFPHTVFLVISYLVYFFILHPNKETRERRGWEAYFHYSSNYTFIKDLIVSKYFSFTHQKATSRGREKNCYIKETNFKLIPIDQHT